MVDAHGCRGAAKPLLFIRHAASIWNVDSRWQGWADPPLADGAWEAISLALQHIPPCVGSVASSDLTRARETARMISEARGLGPAARREELREQHAGDWTGLTKADIKQRWPGLLKARPRQPVGGESYQQVVQRVMAVLPEIARTTKDGCVVIVTHSAVIRSLEQVHSLGSPPVGHLEGRWFGLDPSGRAVPGDLTPGRAGVRVRRGNG